MTYFEEGSEAMVALEAMVDRVGVRNVLYALASICFAKAEHIKANWQDRTTAGVWNVKGHMLQAAVASLTKRLGPQG